MVCVSVKNEGFFFQTSFKKASDHVLKKSDGEITATKKCKWSSSANHSLHRRCRAGCVAGRCWRGAGCAQPDPPQPTPASQEEDPPKLPFLLEDANPPSPGTSHAAAGSAPLPAFEPAPGIALRSSLCLGSQRQSRQHHQPPKSGQQSLPVPCPHQRLQPV